MTGRGAMISSSSKGGLIWISCKTRRVVTQGPAVSTLEAAQRKPFSRPAPTCSARATESPRRAQRPGVSRCLPAAALPPAVPAPTFSGDSRSGQRGSSSARAMAGGPAGAAVAPREQPNRRPNRAPAVRHTSGSAPRGPLGDVVRPPELAVSPVSPTPDVTCHLPAEGGVLGGRGRQGGRCGDLPAAGLSIITISVRSFQGQYHNSHTYNDHTDHSDHYHHYHNDYHNYQ